MKKQPIDWKTYCNAVDACTVDDAKAEEILSNLTAAPAQKPPEKSKQGIYRRYVTAAVAACAVLAVAAVGVGLFGEGGFPTLPPAPVGVSSEEAASSATQSAPDDTSSEEASSTAKPTTSDTSREETPSQPTSATEGTSSVPVPPTPNGEYYWNVVQSGGLTMMYKDPNAVAREVTFSDFCDILGYDPTPTYIPEGYENTSREAYTFYVNPDGSWADHYSFFSLGCSKGQDDISIRIAPTGVEVYANNDVPLNNQALQKSAFDGFEAILMKNNPTPEEIKAYEDAGRTPIDLSAIFQIRGANYYAYTRGNVDADEFLRVIQSLA